MMIRVVAITNPDDEKEKEAELAKVAKEKRPLTAADASAAQ